MNEPLLILDLDETLVWATEDEPAAGSDFRVDRYFVTRRPFLNEFFDRVFDWFKVAVWTSSSGAYARAVVDQILEDPGRLEFLWAADRCTVRLDAETREPYFLKDLKKVRRRGYDLHLVLIVDDSPEKVSRHHGNHLRLEPFEGDPEDRDLVEVLHSSGGSGTSPISARSRSGTGGRSAYRRAKLGRQVTDLVDLSAADQSILTTGSSVGEPR